MNHYDVLEVSPRASAEVIRAAYKSLMQRYHPDRNPELAGTTKDAARITQAYEVLSDAGKRAAYDLELAVAGAPGSSGGNFSPARPAMSAASSRSAAYGRSRPPPGRRSWLAWVVIVCILVAGSIILWQSKKSAKPFAAGDRQGASTASPSSATRLAASAPAQPAASAPVAESDADRQARTIPSFSSSLRIDLVPPDRASTAQLHMLQIPELGFRVDAPDAIRWAKKIEVQRGALLQQLLARMATADYEQLLGADGDLYLKRLIGNAVAEGIGYEDTSPPPPPPLPGAILLPPPPPIAVLLPRSFSVR